MDELEIDRDSGATRPTRHSVNVKLDSFNLHVPDPASREDVDQFFSPHPLIQTEKPFIVQRIKTNIEDTMLAVCQPLCFTTRNVLRDGQEEAHVLDDCATNGGSDWIVDHPRTNSVENVLETLNANDQQDSRHIPSESDREDVMMMDSSLSQSVSDAGTEVSCLHSHAV